MKLNVPFELNCIANAQDKIKIYMEDSNTTIKELYFVYSYIYSTEIPYVHLAMLSDTLSLIIQMKYRLIFSGIINDKFIYIDTETKDIYIEHVENRVSLVHKVTWLSDFIERMYDELNKMISQKLVSSKKVVMENARASDFANSKLALIRIDCKDINVQFSKD